MDPREENGGLGPTHFYQRQTPTPFPWLELLAGVALVAGVAYATFYPGSWDDHALKTPDHSDTAPARLAPAPRLAARAVARIPPAVAR